MKNAVLNNVIGKANLEIQYYLATNTKKQYFRDVLSQLIDAFLKIKATHNYKKIYISLYSYFFNQKT